MIACSMVTSRSRQPSRLRTPRMWSSPVGIPCAARIFASASPCQYSSKFHMVRKVVAVARGPDGDEEVAQVAHRMALDIRHASQAAESLGGQRPFDELVAVQVVVTHRGGVLLVAVDVEGHDCSS